MTAPLNAGAAPLRPLFVTATLSHGGAERHAITLMNRLAERGHECHAVHVKDDAGQRARIRLGATGTVHSLAARRFLDLEALARCARLLQQLRPSVIVAANPYALMYALLAQWRAPARIPVLVVFHSTRILGLREGIKLLLDRCFVRAADCLVFVSENQCRYWRRRALTARRVQVIHNGVDTGEFQLRADADSAASRRGNGGAPADFVIGMVAVLRPEKNHVQLLAAVARLRRQGVPARALLIGDGPMRPVIEAVARQLDIADHVTITGYQDDVRPGIASCDAVVLCSVTEALSLAAIEAMAMGKPVVHSEVGGGAELVLPGYNGYLFPVGDTPALVRCLERLSDRAHASRLGRQARLVVSAKFAEHDMVTRYETLLQTLCAERPVVAPAPLPSEPPASSPESPAASAAPPRLPVRPVTEPSSPSRSHPHAS